MLPAMILCAGFGTRLRPLTDFMPKPLLPVGDRPAFQHIVDQLRSDFSPLVINTHHRAESFKGVVGSDITVVHEHSMLGTAGGVHHARDALGSGECLVWNGDIQVTPDLSALLADHRAAQENLGAIATLLVVDRPNGQGTIGIANNGRVSRMRGESFLQEQIGGDYLGVMVLSERARAALPKRGCLVGDLLLPLLRKGANVAVSFHQGDWIDIGTPALFLHANLRWLDRKKRVSWIAPTASVSPSVQLSNSVVSDGASVVGTGGVSSCVVLPGAKLQAPATGCIVLPNALVEVFGS